MRFLVGLVIFDYHIHMIKNKRQGLSIQPEGFQVTLRKVENHDYIYLHGIWLLHNNEHKYQTQPVRSGSLVYHKISISFKPFGCCLYLGYSLQSGKSSDFSIRCSDDTVIRADCALVFPRSRVLLSAIDGQFRVCIFP